LTRGTAARLSALLLRELGRGLDRDREAGWRGIDAIAHQGTMDS